MPEYQLVISFRSNERPWTGTHDPYPHDRFGKDDEKAKCWARAMAELLWDYNVTLLKDGSPLQYDSGQECM